MTANRDTRRRFVQGATATAVVLLILASPGCGAHPIPSGSATSFRQAVDEPCAGQLDEMEKIERLLAIVAAQQDAKFIRNGTAYSPSEASEHLRAKLKNAGSRIASALDFIEKVGSRSSVSGKEYLIEFPDGHRLTTGEFFRNELAKIELCIEPAVAASE